MTDSTASEFPEAHGPWGTPEPGAPAADVKVTSEDGTTAPVAYIPGRTVAYYINRAGIGSNGVTVSMNGRRVRFPRLRRVTEAGTVIVLAARLTNG